MGKDHGHYFNSVSAAKDVGTKWGLNDKYCTKSAAFVVYAVTDAF